MSGVIDMVNSIRIGCRTAEPLGRLSLTAVPNNLFDNAVKVFGKSVKDRRREQNP